MKNTTKKISAAALALIMGATAFTGCSGGTATSGGTANGADSSAESTTATGSPEDNVFKRRCQECDRQRFGSRGLQEYQGGHQA